MRLLPKRPSGYTMVSVAWRWADLDEESFTTLVNNYLRWCERNSSPGSPAASVSGNLFLSRQELGMEPNQSGVPWSELYYGGNYKRLQEVNGRWDPHQVFNHVSSVEPG